MGNMARDRCSSSTWCTRRSLILALLAFDLLALAAAEASEVVPSDLSPFRYNVDLADDLSDLEPEFRLQQHSSFYGHWGRRRRALPEPAALRPANAEQQHSNFYGHWGRRRRALPEPPAVTPANAEQQPPARSGPEAHPPAQPGPKANSSVSMTYSTSEQNATHVTATPTTLAAPSSSVGATTPGTGTSGTTAPVAGKGVIVSTPIVPSADKNATKAGNATAGAEIVGSSTPSLDDKEKTKVKVWANQTMWSNATESKTAKPPSTEADLDDDFSIDKYPAEVTNKTLHDNNVIKQETDHHQYYNSTFTVDEAVGKKYWVNLDNHPDLQVNPLLSKSHRRAATIKLKFDFPFYGHKVRNITIATGGFLYTGEYVHSWLAATQYIAPLMANFDTTISDQSFVKYADNGTAFTVEWENVHLQDKPDAGAFTFQVTLLQNGDIIFVYSVIPVLVENIEDKEHPVKIGVSDAYMMDRTVFFARRKTIYEYHRVNFNRQDIKNWTAIYLKALPTCLQMENCNDCLTKIKDFECKWCPELQKCSTGTFRFRQEWLQKGCDIRNIREEGRCPSRTTSYREHVDAHAEDHRTEDMPEVTNYSPSQQAVGPASSSLENSGDNMNMGVSGIIGILFIVSLIAGLGAWATYAYRNPHSASGQMLIRYRPSQWSWRRGEARYTAATIHM